MARRGSGKTRRCHRPGDPGSDLGTVPDMDGPETRAAIEAAAAAFGTGSKKTNAERAALLEAWHDLMIENIWRIWR